MAYRIGIVGFENTGKSFSRKYIPDGENVFIIAPSYKATWLTTSEGKPCGNFQIKGKDFNNLEEAMKKLNQPSKGHVIKYFNDKVAVNTLKRENASGNIAVVKDITHLPTWLLFVSKHMPWIHTVILPDFTHFISEVISKRAFMERKAGAEAYSRFWELAADALQGFILFSDQLRDDLIVVTEYHAEFSESGQAGIFSSGGKMLNEKFKPASYYDVMVYTETFFNEDQEISKYAFVTRPTKKFPQARALDLYSDTYVDNNLQDLLTKVREKLGIPIIPYSS